MEFPHAWYVCLSELLVGDLHTWVYGHPSELLLGVSPRSG